MIFCCCDSTRSHALLVLDFRAVDISWHSGVIYGSRPMVALSMCRFSRRGRVTASDRAPTFDNNAVKVRWGTFTSRHVSCLWVPQLYCPHRIEGSLQVRTLAGTTDPAWSPPHLEAHEHLERPCPCRAGGHCRIIRMPGTWRWVRPGA